MKHKTPYRKLTLALATTSVLLAYQLQAQADTQPDTPLEVVLKEDISVENIDLTNAETIPALPKAEAVTEADQAEAEVATPAVDEKAVQSKSTYQELNDPAHVADLQKIAGQGEGSLVAVIDAGLDKTHEMLRLTDTSKAHFKNKEELEKVKTEQNITYGEWVNDKVVFYHDYSEGEPLDASHGSHVAGILTGNSPEETENDYLLKGVLPEAQLIFLRVTAGKDLKEFPRTYAKAITDAVNLGAKTINMSFGQTAQALADLPEETKKAFAYAQSKGVALVASAGNSAAFGGITRLPLADHPDYGVIGAPAVDESILTVAAYSPAVNLSQYATLTDGTTTKDIAVLTTNSFDPNTDYNYVVAGRGLSDDFSEAEGKIALIERGDLDFKDKIVNAKKAGAIGVIIYDNMANGFQIQLPNIEGFPVAFVSQEDGKRLKENATHTLRFSKYLKLLPTASGTRVGNFSSWGLTADGNIKPDIAAPGQDILSGTTDNHYENQSGTSMSAPMVSGVLTLLQDHYASKYPDLSPSQRLDLAKKVLMSSATSLYDDVEKAYYSPRQQGAGAIDAKKAIAAELYLTAKDDKASKIHLKNIGDTFEITVHVHNLSDQDKELYYQANLQTDKVEDGHFALKAHALSESKWEKITAKAKGVTEVRLAVDASHFSKDLLEQMANGYFLEGFIRFKEDNSKDTAELMSLPFIGFRGDFDNLAAIETPIYDSADGSSYYHTPDADAAPDQLDGDGLSFRPDHNNFTALTTETMPWSVLDALLNSEGEDENAEDLATSEVPETIFLGTFAGDVEDGHHYIRRTDDKKPYLAISPNDDGNRDYVQFQGTFLRNVKDLSVQVLDADGKVVWTSEAVHNIRKNYDNTPETILGSNRFEKTRWEGKNQDGQAVADGHYTYRIVYTAASPEAKEQHMDFDIIVNSQMPEIAETATFDDASRTLTLSAEPKTGLPIYRARVAYTYVEEDMPLTLYVEANEDGTFTLPENAESLEGEPIALKLSDFTYVVEDLAGNLAYVSVDKLLGVAPETENPETEKPEAEKPETENPETENPETENPETENPESEKPEAEKPEAENPETKKPKIKQPDAKKSAVENLSAMPSRTAKAAVGATHQLPATGESSSGLFGAIKLISLTALFGLFAGSRKRGYKKD
ncbi:S8 family serine peptidase [Streptococcus phocae subsp. salmonis]|uniref:S8 family serine peptidase n=1 Tax=Streptococcus phocae TaxID=119224 RepID=UPI00069025F0|nr:S8 family serine peptidase [Streptococcus phocae]